MRALLFVHGTGVRRTACDETMTLLRDTMGGLAREVPVHECYWGDAFGVPDGVGTAALPGTAPAEPEPETGADTVTTSELDPDDNTALQWGLLYEDPLSVLRRRPDPAAAFTGIVADRSGPQVTARARNLATTLPDELDQLLAEPRVRQEFTASLTSVLESTEGHDALTHGLGPGELPGALATAIVAHLLGGTQRRGTPVLWSTAQRDEAVRLLTHALGGTARGKMDRAVLRASLWTARRFGVMRRLDKNRADLMTGAHPKLGDTLKYLARGRQLRTLLKDRITQLNQAHGPVVLLAHSLGGIVAVDLLIEEELPGVHHLVTVGTQAAHLHELGALPSLEPGTPLPEHFPGWTNVYDKRDLLGFTAEPVFPDRVDDVELNSGEPFPVAHNAYFTNPDFQNLLARILLGGA
ncbi:hypothetical protein [Streptomyces sp. NPDC001315]|uniref:hypothetical protein n=1 Tax=Streptomyces sp. NPDC001315 TaxID=3364562 RepID=UPI003681E89C